jgi:hypothetical protein
VPQRHRVHQRTPETVGLAQLVGEDPAFVTLKRKLPPLAEVYGLFTEGFDTPDLQEAKALLEQFGV